MSPIILAWCTEREEGVTTSTLTFEGEVSEWTELCDRQNDFAANVLVRNITRVCVAAGRADDPDE